VAVAERAGGVVAPLVVEALASLGVTDAAREGGGT